MKSKIELVRTKHIGIRRDLIRSRCRYFPYFSGRYIRGIVFVILSIAILVAPGLILRCQDEATVRRCANKLAASPGDINTAQPGIFMLIAQIFLEHDPNLFIDGNLDIVESKTRKITTQLRRLSIEHGGKVTSKLVVGYMETILSLSNGLKYRSDIVLRLAHLRFAIENMDLSEISNDNIGPQISQMPSTRSKKNIAVDASVSSGIQYWGPSSVDTGADADTVAFSTVDKSFSDFSQMVKSAIATARSIFLANEAFSDEKVQQKFRSFEFERLGLLELIENLLTKDKRFDTYMRDQRKLVESAFILKWVSKWVSVFLAISLLLYWKRTWSGRHFALGQGRNRALLVIFVFIVLQMYNLIFLRVYQGSHLLPQTFAVPQDTSLIIEQYKTAVKEILHRLEQEQYLYILKFSMIGALFAVFFQYIYRAVNRTENGNAGHFENSDSAKDSIDRLKQSKVAAFFFWAAVIVNCIIDTRIRYYSEYCIALGQWVKTLERSIEESYLSGWETFLSEQTAITSSPLMAISPTLLTTIVFVLTIGLFVVQKEKASIRGHIGDKLTGINVWFGSLAFVLLAFSGLVGPGMTWHWFGPVGLWSLVGILVLWNGPRHLTSKVFRKDEITESIIAFAFPFHYINFAPKFLMRSVYRSRADKRNKISIFKSVFCRVGGFALEVASYAPFQFVRNKLFRQNAMSAGNVFQYLEISEDPEQIEDIYPNAASDENSKDQKTIWTYMYLWTSDDGYGDITQNMVPGHKVDDDDMIVEWLKNHTYLLKDMESNPSKNSARWVDRFKLYDPQLLYRRQWGAVQDGDFAPDSADYRDIQDVVCTRIYDYYFPQDPWILLVFKLARLEGESESEKTEVVLFSFKDGDKHIHGMPMRKLSREDAVAPASVHDSSIQRRSQ